MYLNVHGCFFTHLQLSGKTIQLQVVETQWLLIVELHQFHNLYNAKVVSGDGFCCCDYSPNNVCNQDTAEDLECEVPCEIWLNTFVSHCTEPSPCSFSTLGCSVPSPASTYNFTEKFVFVLSASVSPDEVRVTQNLCNHH